MNALDVFALAAAGGAAGADLYMAVSVFRRWKRKRKPAADAAVAWWLWNWLSGARIGAGPSLSDEAVAVRATKAVPRWLPPVVLLASVYRWSPAPWQPPAPQLVAGSAAGTVLLAAVAWLAVHEVCEWWHRFLWVRPLEAVLRPVLGWAGPARRWLHVPRDKADVIVAVRPTWTGKKAEKELVQELVVAKLGVSDVTHHWERKARHNYLQTRGRSHPPKTAFFAEPLPGELVRKAKASIPAIGVTAGNAAVTFHWDTEAPHVLLSAGTGGAKSSTIRTIAAQLLHHGALVIVLDYKRHSQPWLRGLPGVWYFRDIGDIYDALLALAAEGERRNRAHDDVPLGEAGPWFPRILVICEELNATMSKLRSHWRQNLKVPGETQCPAILALGDLLFMGRQVRIHVAAIAQMATVKDLGGTEHRENFAYRILSRYSPQAWQMLVPDCPYTPSTQHPGRAQVCVGGTATETQLIYMTDREAHDWALAGDKPLLLDVAASRLSQYLDHLGKHAATVASPAPALPGPTPALEPAERHPELDLVTLGEVSTDRGDGSVPMRYGALRQAILRDKRNGAPKPVTARGGTPYYERGAVQQYVRNRERDPARKP